MKKLVKKSQRVIVLLSVLALVASPALVKNPGARTASFGDIWLIGGW